MGAMIDARTQSAGSDFAWLGGAGLTLGWNRLSVSGSLTDEALHQGIRGFVAALRTAGDEVRCCKCKHSRRGEDESLHDTPGLPWIFAGTRTVGDHAFAHNNIR